jgi:hypothetical protein
MTGYPHIATRMATWFSDLPAYGHFTITAARVLMYAGLLSFIPFIHAYIILRRNEPGQDASGVSPKI